jgi:DNA adenine methylase
MRPPFCRVGSKKPIANKIINMIPPHEIYVEPFVGSGAIYWTKEQSKKEVINDLDKQLMNNYKLLKRTKERNFKSDLDTVDEIQRHVNTVHNTDGGRLLKEIAISCNTFGNTGRGGIYKPSNPYNKLKNIDEYQKRMDNTTILNQDYKTVIKKYDSPQTFFFLDPPYESSEKLYKKGSFNFAELNNVLENIKGEFLLTLNDSKNIRTIFRGFKITGITVPARGNKGIGVKDRKELIIKNY